MFNSDVSGGFSSFAGSTWPLEDDADFLTLLSDPKAAQTLSLGTVQPSDLNSRQLNISPPSSEADSPPSQSAGPQLATQTSTTITPFSSTGLNDMNANSRATRSANRDSQTGEPAPKRRLLDDVDEESDDDSLQRSKKTSAKRKSIGGPDESRLMKRKEQNRAAQRAFRERKERHVKDLEDKVSILEAKTDTQAAENENLRELLTRLQQENLQLKQTQFNFTFQQPIASTSANPNSSAQPYPARQASTSSDTNMAGPTASGPSPSSQSPMDASSLTRPTNGTVHASSSTPQLTNSSASPNDLNLLESLGLSTSTPDLSFPGISPAGQGSNSNQGSFTMMDTSFFNNTPSANGASTDFNSFDLGGFTPMPFQTIAASPWSSYRDPSANPNAWASFGPNSSQSLALNTYDELFGGAGSLSGLPSAGPDSSMAGSAIDDLMPFSFMPDLSSGNGGSQFGGLSPISHLPTPPSATAAPATNSSTSGKQVTTPISKDHDMSNSESPHDASAHTGEDTGDCPRSKEEFAEHIQKMGSGTFGPPIDGSIGIIAIPSALASGSTGPSPSGSSGNAESGDASCTKKMPMADSTKLNLDLGTAWRAVRQHPQFEECDIDELCAELAQKATCDGNTKVIEAQKIMDLVHSIPERAKQRKLSMAARMSA